jgi:hypothetical protein
MDYTPEEIENLEPNDFAQFIRKCLLDYDKQTRLLEYKLRVSDTVILYLLSVLDNAKVDMNETDNKIVDMYAKVSSSESFETAEAHFAGIADEFSKNVGFTDFDELVNKVKNAITNIKEGESIEEVINFVINKHTDNTDS